MTLPNERTYAVLNARRFLMKLLDPKATPRVPKAIRKEAYWILKHYPHPYDFYMLFKYKNEIFAETEETKGMDE